MQPMKRLFQFVAFALVLIGASQPLLADTACTQPQCEGNPVCSMHFESMAIPNSAIQPMLASSQSTAQVVFAEAGCGYGWCWLRSDSIRLLVVAPPTFRLANGSTFLVPVAQLSASPAVILAAGSPEDTAVGAVPRNILFQVFRI